MFRRSILAGMFIAIASMLYLLIGGIEGAVLFSVGLLGVVTFNAHLFTGRAGFIDSLKSVTYLFSIILIGNMIGVALVSLPIRLAEYNLTDAADKLIELRLNSSYVSCYIRSMFCGLLMTTAVYGVSKNTYLPLLFSVPAFILCGFYHSIADWSYWLMSSHDLNYLPKWLVIVLGNFAGCNLPNALKSRSFWL